jgi:hypothetical protein
VPAQREQERLSFRDTIAKLDLLGATVGITAMILFNFAWNQAPGFGWHQVYIYVMLIVGILLFPVFLYIELKVSKHPLIPFDALTTDVSFVLVCEMCGWAAFGTPSPQHRVLNFTNNRQASLSTTTSKSCNASAAPHPSSLWRSSVPSLSQAS